MSTINSDIQASHQLIALLENSKEHAEGFLDQLPGVFLIMDSRGRIMRGNSELARLLACELEDLIDQNFSSLFLTESWKAFQANYSGVSIAGRDHVDFEMKIDGTRAQQGEGEGLPYSWRVQLFNSGAHSRVAGLLTVIGRDLSELRRSEREFADFSQVFLLES